ncbi:MAG: hypothetical protein WC761_03320 [Candidatus Paceibacterota bacterium]|jgi:hypothetical protein
MKKTAQKKQTGKVNVRAAVWSLIGCAIFLVILFLIPSGYKFEVGIGAADAEVGTSTVARALMPIPLDKAAYNRKLLAISHIPEASTTPEFLSGETTLWKTASTSKLLWPAKITAYPNAGAILPFKRIVAYYGNFYSKGMGVLGQYPEEVVIQKLLAEVAEWNAADPSTPVVPAIDYIASTAQLDPGKSGKYTARMPDSQIDIAIALAKKVNGIVILELQVGLSNLPTELPILEKYLKMPEVHLALDPEFAMHGGARPGTVIGSFDAADINFAANYLAKIVQENNLPPKVLVVHRFTHKMVTNYQNITPLPEVQIVMDMDGWGDPAKKKGTYKQVIYPEPVQFTGFKLFYKNDLLPPSTRMLQKDELLQLTPAPLFIQYQ